VRVRATTEATSRQKTADYLIKRLLLVVVLSHSAIGARSRSSRSSRDATPTGVTRRRNNECASSRWGTPPFCWGGARSPAPVCPPRTVGHTGPENRMLYNEITDS